MVISRFAPSPTGDLHIGGVRTALYAWLYAKQQNGQFILRIEDTDKERSTKEASKGIIEGLKWLSLDYNGEPYYQSEHMDKYENIINQLLDSGNAYKCYCTKDRLDKLREQQMANKQKPKYDGHCRLHSPDSKNKDINNNYVVRFATPQNGETSFEDRVRGLLKVNNEELDDLVIRRSDGSPTYNLSVVADDIDMGVTMIIRGDDHINNTFRQINIYKALAKKPPQFAHVSSILGSDGQKLSKRHGAASVLAYRDLGILPEALINALVRLGWAHGDQEIFSIDEMINLFKLDNVHKSPAVFDSQKLYWFNQHYIKHMDNDELAKRLSYYLSYDANSLNSPNLSDVVAVLKTRAKDLIELADKAAIFYLTNIEYNQEAVDKFFNDNTGLIFEQVSVELDKIANQNWNADNLKVIFKDLLAKLNLKMPELAQPMRIALTGNTDSPPINETLALIGKEEVLNRLRLAREFLRA